MTKYLYRSCPKYGDYLGVVVLEPAEPVEEIPIKATSLRCGYKLPWKVVQGKAIFFDPDRTNRITGAGHSFCYYESATNRRNVVAIPQGMMLDGDDKLLRRIAWLLT